MQHPGWTTIVSTWLTGEMITSEGKATTVIPAKASEERYML